MAEAELWHLEHRVHIGVHAGDGEGGGEGGEIKHLDVGADWAGGGHVRDRHLLDFLTTSGFLQTTTNNHIFKVFFFVKRTMFMFECQQ